MKLTKKNIDWFINATEENLGIFESDDKTHISDYDWECEWNIEDDWFDKVTYRISELIDIPDYQIEVEQEICSLFIEKYGLYLVIAIEKNDYYRDYDIPAIVKDIEEVFSLHNKQCNGKLSAEYYKQGFYNGSGAFFSEMQESLDSIFQKYGLEDYYEANRYFKNFSVGMNDEDLENEITEKWLKRDERFLQKQRRPSIIWLEKNNCTAKDIADFELVISKYEKNKKPKNYYSLNYDIDANKTLKVTVEITPDKTEFAPDN
jgi:hypothetical protein